MLAGHGWQVGWRCQPPHSIVFRAGCGGRSQASGPGWGCSGQQMSRVLALLVLLLVAAVLLGGSLALLVLPARAGPPVEVSSSVVPDEAVAGSHGIQVFETVPVTITAAGFSPRVVTVTTCAPVEWTNLTSVNQHIVGGTPQWHTYLPVIGRGGIGAADPGLSDDQSLAWSGLVPANGGKLARTFAIAGTYPYYLADTPDLAGTVVVMNLTNFTTEVNPSSRMVGRSGQTKYIVRVVARGLQPSRVTLTASDAQGGTSFSWSANPVTPTQEAVLTVAAASGAPLGVHQLTITGDDGCLQRTVTTTLNVVETVAADLYLPVIFNDSWPGAGSQWRFGFGVAWAEPVGNYDVALLRAGWYFNWVTDTVPSGPVGLEYMHTVTVKGSRTCASLTPYVMSSPGSWWFIGNEPDRIIYQDDREPDDYASIYHDLYLCIKTQDVTAKVAPGGIVQPTPVRLQYLDMVLQAYRSQYGVQLPADGWNIHNLLLRERSCAVYPDDCWGADIPPGVPAVQGMLYEVQDNDNVTYFQNQIVAFRQWMKRNGYQNVPLIVSEYGISMPADYGFDAQRVIRYMYETFRYLLSAKDCSLGYPADGCRLVQRWGWYSLNDRSNARNGQLFDPTTRQVTVFGLAYRNRPYY
jgi:plastocyanin